MTNKVKDMFALTDSGAKGMIKASFGTFLMYIAYMLPITVLMFFINEVIENRALSIVIYLAMLLVLSIIMYIFINFSYKTTYNETYKEAAVLRLEIADLLKKLPLSYFSKHDTADLSQTVMHDVADIEHAMSHSIPEIIGFMFYFIIVSIMLLIGNIKLGIAVIVPVIISFLLLVLSKKLQVSSTTKYFEQLRENSDIFQEAIELQQEIKSYGRKESTVNKIMNTIDKTEKLHIITEIAQALPTSFSGVLLKFSLGLTVVTGTLLYMKGEINLLYLTGYLIAAARIMDGVAGIYANIAEVMYIDARIKRIKELRNTPLQEGTSYKLKGYDIEFKNVSFSYNSETKVIDGLSFTANHNEVTALIGPSGCGKTTALRLMSRLYDYDSGSIEIGGKDIKGIKTEDLFDDISIVFQEVSLFNTSILENIRMGRKNADDEEVKEAARLAGCEEFILSFSDGYNTLIGENGMKLSGGERQRLSIARAILKNAPIILLDEISASLDIENETKIQESLKHLIKGKTVVIISHRMRSIEKADKIVLMDKGKVCAIGTHEELLSGSELYRQLTKKAELTAGYTY
ncbi:MAG: ABC transporter ATP-binding protein [Catonella sp.]